MKKFALCMLILLFAVIAVNSFAGLIPTPREIKWGQETIDVMQPVLFTGGKSNPLAYKALKDSFDQLGIKYTESDKSAQTIVCLGKTAAEKYISDIEANLKKIEPKEGYILSISKFNGKGIICLAGVSEAGLFYSVQTLKQMLIESRTLKTVLIRDYPAYAKERGYGEFFYGKPWSHEERLAGLKFMSEMKLNFYMYSPKDDPYNRDRWREDYPELDVKRVKEIVDYANENFITFSFAVNPGLSMKYSDEKDFEILMKKYYTMYDQGVRNFSLQLDDLGSATKHPEDAVKFPKPGQAHGYMFNKVYHALKKKDPKIEYSICDVMYYIAKPDEYTYTIGEMVDQEIPIMWTGGDVVDDEITVDEVYQFASGIKRKPFISDNYPVNDFAVNRLFMGPMTGRSKDLIYHVYNGYLQNPMNQEEASKIALATIADYVWNPFDYDPETSWNNAIKLIAGERGFDALRLFCENNRSSVMEKRESIELNSLINEYFNKPDETSKKNLEKYLTRLSTLDKDLNDTVDNKKLLEEIKPWVNKLVLFGKAGLLALEIQTADDSASVQEQWNKWNDLNRQMTEINKLKEEVCSGTVERLIYRALIGGKNLGVTFKTPSAIYNPSAGQILDPLGSYTLDNLSNGTPSYFVSSRPLKNGDYVQVSFTEPKLVDEIEIQQAAVPEFPTHFIYDGELQYSSDMNEWKPLAKAVVPEFKWISSKPVKVQAVRLLCSADQKYPLVVREIKTHVVDHPVVSTNIQEIDKDLRTYVCDGNTSSVVSFGPMIKKGGYVKVEFSGEKQPVGKIVAYMNEEKKFKNAALETSTDGKSWTKACDVNSSAVSFDLGGKNIKAARIVTKEVQDSLVVIHEFALSDPDGFAY